MENDDPIYYEGAEIVDYPDLLQKCTFKTDLEGIEKTKEIDHGFLKALTALSVKEEQMWKSTMGVKLLILDQVDRIDYEIKNV